MLLAIIGAILLVGAIGAFIWSLLVDESSLKFGSLGVAAVGVILVVISCFYTQDVGEAKVIKNIDGSIAFSDTTSGFGSKLPWQDAIDFDITGQQALYKLDGKPTSDKEHVNGPAITIQDKDNVSADVDVAVRYSVDPNSIQEIYTTYKSQEVFVQRLIDQDIRSTVRDVYTAYPTDQARTLRGEIEKKVADRLKSLWTSRGVLVDTVALQGVRYPQSIEDRFTDAQNAKTKVSQEQANLEAAKISAQQQVVQAQSAADANKILSQSLTPEILQQRQLDTLRDLGAKGNVIVVPNGSSPLINVPDKK